MTDASDGGTPFFVFVSKYALTRGILRVEVRDVGDGMVRVGRTAAFFHGEGREWHRTQSAAEARANAMLASKLTRIAKAFSRLKALDFTDFSDLTTDKNEMK